MHPKVQARLVVVLGLAVLVFGIVATIYAVRDNDASPDPMFAEIGLAVSGGIIAALGVAKHHDKQPDDDQEEGEEWLPPDL